MASTWTQTDPRWNALTDSQKAAAMALMEADARNPNDARNAAGAMVNRSVLTGEPLGQHVSRRIYQPTFEPSQQARLGSILASPAHGELSNWVAQRQAGQAEDPVNGATHFLAKPSVMLALEARQPSKYRNWGPRGQNWTGYNEATGQYSNQVFEDASHAFLTPDKAGSAPASYRVAGGGLTEVQQQTQQTSGGGDMAASPVQMQQVQKSAAAAGIELPDSAIRKIADAMSAGGRQMAQNARGPWEAAGSIAQSAVGAWANNRASEQEKNYTKTLGAALSGAGDSAGLSQALLSSGDPEMAKLGVSLRLKAMQGENPQAAAELEKTRAETQRIKADTIRKEQPAAMTADQRKATLTADQTVRAADQTMTSLGKMAELNDQAYSGPAASTRGYLGSLIGLQGGAATEEFTNTATATVLENLRATFGGNPTEGERKVLEQMAGSVNQAPAVRKAIIQRAMDALQVRREAAAAEANQLREGTYFKPGGGVTAPAPSGGRPQVEGVQPGAVKTFRVEPPQAGGWSAQTELTPQLPQVQAPRPVTELSNEELLSRLGRSPQPAAPQPAGPVAPGPAPDPWAWRTDAYGR